MDKELEDIKAEHFAALGKRDVILIVKSDYGYDVEQWSATGVWPTSSYDNVQEAAARALQLLGISAPVTPQSWPESARIDL